MLVLSVFGWSFNCIDNLYCFQQLCYLLPQPQRFNKLLSFSVIFNFVFDQCAGLVALFSLCCLTAVHAFCLCAVFVLLMGIAVIQLCSLYLNCQVMSKRAYNLPPLSHPFASMKWQREQEPSAHVLVKFSSLQKIQWMVFLEMLMQHFTTSPKLLILYC